MTFIRGNGAIEICEECLLLRKEDGFLSSPGTPWLGDPSKMFISDVESRPEPGIGFGSGFKLSCYVLDPNFSWALMDFLKDGESVAER